MYLSPSFLWFTQAQRRAAKGGGERGRCGEEGKLRGKRARGRNVGSVGDLKGKRPDGEEGARLTNREEGTKCSGLSQS